MKIVIMAGGKGTRIAEVNSQVPKPMIPIDGKPILEHQINVLKRQGYREFILIIGHLGHIIQDYFKDGSGWDVHIQYITEESPLGTAGALYFLKEEIRENFLLVNGDIIFDVDIARFLDSHRRLNTIATILTHPNSHPYDSGIIIADENRRVTDWLHKEDQRHWYKNRVNAGLHMLSPDIFRYFPDLQKRDLDRDILKPLISSRELGIYDSPEYVKDMGTPDRYCSVAEDIRCRRVEARNLRKRQRAIFLDRDGTLNKYVGFLTDINDLELMDDAAEAVRRINASGYLAIVITNQPVIARGEVSMEELTQIHNKMETLLGQEGAYIDALYFCPHHPDKGFAGERPQFKTECSCRKPKPGMLLQAAQDYNIDLSKSWMIGDSDSDIKAGAAAGCGTVMLDAQFSLLQAVEQILDAGSLASPSYDYGR
ncbi:MAG: HAD-IIIA family hydrolase [Acetatifactor sp.]|nr:HAD-IIIA family hydrolase [Acetatifactor sp.]